MKKFFKYMALVAVAIMTTTAFTACNDDDDDNNGSSQEASVVTWSWTASDTISEALLDVFEYTTTITLPDGSTQTLDASYSASSSLTGLLIASKVSYPATITVTTTRKLAADHTITSGEKVSGTETCALTIAGLDSNGLIVKRNQTGSSHIVDKLDVAAWAERYPNGVTIDTHSITLTKTSTGYEIVKPGTLTDY